MGIKLTISNISADYGALTNINNAFDQVETAIDNTLSRDGTGPNYMDAELDMNSNTINNLGAPQSSSSAARLKDVTTTGTINIGRTVAQSVYGLTQQDTTDEQNVYVTGFYSTSTVEQGTYVWSSSTDKSTANGGTIIDPDNIGTLSATALGTFLTVQGTGSGTGCWVLIYEGPVHMPVFGTLGTGNDNAALSKALNSVGSVIIPKGTTVNITTDVTVSSEAVLIIEGELAGSAKLIGTVSLAVIGTGTISIDNTSDYNIEFKGGVVRCGGGLKFTGDGYGIGVVPSSDITDLTMDDISFNGLNYGILRNTSAGFDVFDATIRNIKALNMTGDPVEWNIGPGDKRLSIHDIHCYNIDGALTNQGIGVGVAGQSTYDENWATGLEHMEIYNIFGTSLRQAVHVEGCENFSIYDIFLNDISNAYSAGTGLAAQGVAIYGCRKFKVDGVYGKDFTSAGLLFIDPGVVASAYTSPCYDYEVTNISGDNAGAITLTHQGQDKYCKVSNITGRNGTTLVLNGAVSDYQLEDIDIVTAAKTTGLTIDWADATRNNTALQATKARKVRMVNVNVRDTLGEPYVTLTDFKPEILDATDCNFTVTSSNTASTQIQKVYYTDAGTFPYGKEYQVGTQIYDTGATPDAMYLVTTEGSRNRGADTCEVFDQANKIIKSTNLVWTTLTGGGHHTVGQNITISNIGPAGGDLVTRVVRVFTSGGFYKIEVEDAITAVDTTAGTITATNAVAYSTFTSA